MSKQSPIILAFDTSMSACSAGLYDDKGKALNEKHEVMSRGQAERLVPMIEEIIKESNLDYKNLDFLACTHGPGAFTGLRLSLATAKALSLSLEIPCIGISTLESIYQTLPKQEENVLVCLETKRKDYYTQVFSPEGSVLTPPKSIATNQVSELIQAYSPVVTGDATERLQGELSIEVQAINIPHPSCAAISGIALKKLEPTGARLQNMDPLYLRDADVSFPATKK